MDSAWKTCLVCLGRMPPEAYAAHMETHPKDELVAALVRQNTAASSGLIRTPPAPLMVPQMSNLSVAAAQIPQMAQMPLMPGMSLVPILIPQPNGQPPIICHFPSYGFPNLLNNSSASATATSASVASAASVASTVPSSLIPNEPETQPSQETETTSSMAPAASLGQAIEARAATLAAMATASLPNLNPLASAASPRIEPGSPKPGPSRGGDSEVQKICTVETVNDLKDAQMLLKNDEDVQIVVAHNLLETNEFKSFMSHLNLPASQTPKSENQKPSQVPPNTRVPSPDPKAGTSAMAEAEAVDEPMIGPDSDSDDDDICLQDLVAMETMDDNDDSNDSNVVIEEDDQVFTIGTVRSSNLEPSFVDAILHTETENFECDSCGLHFPTHESYHNHQVDHCKKKCRISKAKKSSTLELIEVKSENASLLSSADLALNSQPSTSSGIFKSEFSSQPALGSIHDNQFKCFVCMKIFTSGLELHNHQQEVKNAEHKCTTCHVILEDRQAVLAHKKEFHLVPKIKTEIEFEDSKDVMPNENGEYVCDKCDRVFLHKEQMVNHMLVHQEDKPFECLECGKKFAKAVFLRDHRKRHFEKGDYECPLCLKRFHTPSKLREHHRVHTGKFEFVFVHVKYKISEVVLTSTFKSPIKICRENQFVRVAALF